MIWKSCTIVCALLTLAPLTGCSSAKSVPLPVTPDGYAILEPGTDYRVEKKTVLAAPERVTQKDELIFDLLKANAKLQVDLDACQTKGR